MKIKLNKFVKVNSKEFLKLPKTAAKIEGMPF